MQIIIKLKERGGFGEVDFSSCGTLHFEDRHTKKLHRNHEGNKKKTQEEASKNHYIIAFGKRTDAGHTAHLQQTRLQN